MANLCKIAIKAMSDVNNISFS